MEILFDSAKMYQLVLDHQYPSSEGLGAAAAAVSELRARNQRDNSKQTEVCPVCGDKANGLHYGIYTCEA